MQRRQPRGYSSRRGARLPRGRPASAPPASELKTMIPPGECTYAGRKRRKPIQKRRPAMGAETSNPSKRHRDRLNAELDHLASLLPFPPDVISKLDKLSVLRLSVSYLRVKSFFQAVQETRTLSPGDGRQGGAPVQEGRLLLESLNGFALVVSAEGMIFYASATIVDYLGFHQTDVMHQNIYDYIHVDDRQDFCRQLHWAMDPPQTGCGQPPHRETADDTVLGRLLRAQEGGVGSPTEYSAFLTRCFICRVRCLLDSTSGFLTMQFQGKLRFLLGQKKKAPSGTVLPPRLSLFCTVVPVVLPSTAEMKMKNAYLRAKHRADLAAMTDTRTKATMSLCESELHGQPNYLAGRTNGENSISVFRAQTDAGHWARVPARAPCPCLRSGTDLILDSKGATGDREETEQDRMLSSSTGGRTRREMHVYNCRPETPVPGTYPNWMTEKCGQDSSAKLKLLPGRREPLSMCATSPGSCVSHPGTQSTFSASSLATFRNSPGHVPSTYCGRMSRSWRDVHQGQVPPPTCCTGVQHFTPGNYCTEDAKPPNGLPMPPCNPMLPLEVPIKMENDSGSEDTAEGCAPSQVWLGASDITKRHLVTFPTRMHLKAEPDCRHQVYTPPLSLGMLAAHPQSRVTARPCRELASFYPARSSCLEPGPLRHLCTLGHSECEVPKVTPMVKREPLDSPAWAAPGRGTVPAGVFPKSASVTRILPRAPEANFLL